MGACNGREAQSDRAFWQYFTGFAAAGTGEEGGGRGCAELRGRRRQATVSRIRARLAQPGGLAVLFCLCACVFACSV